MGKLGHIIPKVCSRTIANIVGFIEFQKFVSLFFCSQFCELSNIMFVLTYKNSVTVTVKVCNHFEYYTIHISSDQMSLWKDSFQNRYFGIIDNDAVIVIRRFSKAYFQFTISFIKTIYHRFEVCSKFLNLNDNNLAKILK